MSTPAVLNYARSPANLSKISTEVFVRAQQLFGIRLDANFKTTLLGVVENTLKQFGHKTVNISDGEHLANLNRIIVEDCLRYVGQYRNAAAGMGGAAGMVGGAPGMGGAMAAAMASNANPFADLSDTSADSSRMNQMVENLAAARGYRIQQESGTTPRIDFADPVQDHKMSAEEMAKKLQEERAIGGAIGGENGSGSGVALNEILGTSRPAETYNPTSGDPRSEYHKRLDLIRGRGQGNGTGLDGTVAEAGLGVGLGDATNAGGAEQGLPVDLPRGNAGPHPTPGNSFGAMGAASMTAVPALATGNNSLSSSRRTVRVSLDFRRSLESKKDGTYIVRFPPVQNCIGIHLETCSTMGYPALTEDPSISVHVSNLPSRYGTDSDLFSKMYLEKEINGFYHYRSEEGEPLRFQRPLSSISYLEVSFRTWDDQNIDLDGLNIEQIVKITKSRCMKIICYEPHMLSAGEPLSLQIGDHFAQRLKILKVVDDCTVVTDLPEKMLQGQGASGGSAGGKLAITRIFPRVTMNLVLETL